MIAWASRSSHRKFADVSILGAYLPIVKDKGANMKTIKMYPEAQCLLYSTAHQDHWKLHNVNVTVSYSSASCTVLYLLKIYIDSIVWDDRKLSGTEM